MNQTSSEIQLFNLHDSPVISITIEGTTITLELKFAHIDRGHPSNPFPLAQCIMPCTLKFQGVSQQASTVWDELTKSFKPHPCPNHPIEVEIIEFEPVISSEGYSIKLAGSHRAGWAEWQITCTSVLVSWSEFSGKAWYES